MEQEFQSLIGKLQTKNIQTNIDAKLTFQSLIGKLQTRGRVGDYAADAGFNPS